MTPSGPSSPIKGSQNGVCGGTGISSSAVISKAGFPSRRRTSNPSSATVPRGSPIHLAGSTQAKPARTTRAGVGSVRPASTSNRTPARIVSPLASQRSRCQRVRATRQPSSFHRFHALAKAWASQLKPATDSCPLDGVGALGFHEVRSMPARRSPHASGLRFHASHHSTKASRKGAEATSLGK